VEVLIWPGGSDPRVRGSNVRCLVARVTALGALVAVSIAASGLVVALSLAPGSGLAWTVLGAAASVLVVGSAVRLVRRPV